MKYLLPLLFIMASTAHAADWTYVTTDSGGTKFYVDKDSIQTHRFSGGGNYKTAWTKLEFSNTKKLDFLPHKLYNESKDFRHYDCTAKRGTTESVHFYLNGQSISSGSVYVPTSSSTTWDRIIPDTVGEGMLNFVCRH